MKFLFDLWFWMITFIIISVFLFYKPAETLTFIAVVVLICVIGAVLFHRHIDR